MCAVIEQLVPAQPLKNLMTTDFHSGSSKCLTKLCTNLIISISHVLFLSAILHIVPKKTDD